MQTIEELWKSYLEEVVPGDAGPVQIHETRQAFKAGAFAMFHMNAEIIKAGPIHGQAHIDALHAESAAYRAEINKAVDELN